MYLFAGYELYSCMGCSFILLQGGNSIGMHEKCVKRLFLKFNLSYRGVYPFKTSKILKMIGINKLYFCLDVYKVVRLEKSETVRSIVSFATASRDYASRNRNLPRTSFPRVNAIKSNHKYKFLSIDNK